MWIQCSYLETTFIIQHTFMHQQKIRNRKQNEEIFRQWMVVEKSRRQASLCPGPLIIMKGWKQGTVDGSQFTLIKDDTMADVEKNIEGRDKQLPENKELFVIFVAGLDNN